MHGVYAMQRMASIQQMQFEKNIFKEPPYLLEIQDASKDISRKGDPLQNSI